MKRGGPVVVAAALVVAAAQGVAGGAAGLRSTEAPIVFCFGKRATIVGKAADETLRGTKRGDVIFAGKGDDRVNGRGGRDLICGGEGDDVLIGGGGSDKLAGAAGDNDLLAGGPGDDLLDGGDGLADGVDYSAGAPKRGVEVRLFADSATGAGEDEFAGIENVTGTEHDDAIYGDERPNVILGLGGNDTLLGNLGPDVIVPGDGDDTVNGGGDPDIVDYFFSTPTGPMTIDLSAGTAVGMGSDTLESIEGAGGGEFDDSITGSVAMNVLFGFGGNDVLLAGGGDNDIVQGGLGDDTIDGGTGSGDAADYNTPPSPPDPITVDLTAGTATGHGSDTIVEIEKVDATPSNDSITGDAEVNDIIAYEGDDTVSGLEGDDFLVGREGTDTLDGGDGTDDCVSGETNLNCEFVYRPARRSFPTPSALSQRVTVSGPRMLVIRAPR